MICSLLLTKVTYLCQLCLTFHHHLTQLITLPMYTFSIVTLDLLILSSDDFHLIGLIAHSTSLYPIIVLLLLLQTLVFLKVQFMTLYFSSCTVSLCLPLLIHTLSHTIHLLMTYNNRCLLLLIICNLLHSIQSCISDI